MKPTLLDPVSRISEILFGLLMALTFTTTLNLVDTGLTQARAMFHAALGCNIAWGIVDAVMYLVRLKIERSHRVLIWRRVHAADAETGRRLLAAELGTLPVLQLSPTDIEGLRQCLLGAGPPPARVPLAPRDYAAAGAVFMLVAGATLPVALPFLLLTDLQLAMRVSGALAIAMMMGSGVALGFYAGLHPLRTGLAMLALGASLVATTLVFGG